MGCDLRISRAAHIFHFTLERRGGVPLVDEISFETFNSVAISGLGLFVGVSLLNCKVATMSIDNMCTHKSFSLINNISRWVKPDSK